MLYNCEKWKVYAECDVCKPAELILRGAIYSTHYFQRTLERDSDAHEVKGETRVDDRLRVIWDGDHC